MKTNANQTPQEPTREEIIRRINQLFDDWAEEERRNTSEEAHRP